MPFQPSNYAATYLGGLGAASTKQKAAYGAAALRARARMKAAEMGAEIAADDRKSWSEQQAANRSAQFGQTLLGLAGNALSSGLNAWGQQRADQSAWNQERYGSPSLTPFEGTLPSTTGFGGLQSAPPPVPGFGSPASVQYGSGASAPIFKPSTSYFG